MKYHILILLMGVLMSSVRIINAAADDQQDVRCVLGGSAIAGMVVHIDPETGRPTSHPLPEQAAEIAKVRVARANLSTNGLVQEVGPTGGVRVNLQNRFRSPLVTVVTTDGSLHTDHVSCVQASSVVDQARSGEMHE